MSVALRVATTTPFRAIPHLSSQVVQMRSAPVRTRGSRPAAFAYNVRDTGDWGQILVDDNFKTSAEHIFALGDVITRIELTPSPSPKPSSSSTRSKH